MGDLSQFHIPVYQRVYTWDAENQIKRLLDDIIAFGKEYEDAPRAIYYIGNAIVKNQTRGFIDERVVIDGQQRITTTILILCAIRDVYLKIIKTDKALAEANQMANSTNKFV
ncbi:MAG: DUF262 domain-containing protein [Methylococcales symbiont of Iophon sp. n. MRB-2018]|nr:MAG: DUF262 domain-containing protein [Methylococcales symbiont of Iophon sp. n. MRB-2018]KAF3978951.1 MAG: DUF262 domain-containing protein [Methylococcales symbiont of Iophon sp. n. MRB-2018]